MRVAFLHVRQSDELARKMVASARRHMDCEIVQMCDDETALPGCVAQRIPWDGGGLMEYRLQHLAQIPDGDTLILDADVIVQHDLSPLFAFPFDLALTKRYDPILDCDGTDLAKVMPYNTGVMFSRRQQFWAACYEWIKTAPPGARKWYGDQMAVAALAPAWNVLNLHCDNFNYSPETEGEEVSDRLVVHYKGERRKPWMLRR